MQGTLADSPLPTLIQGMQAERATGTLSVEHDSNETSLYFLFGHLFHADNGSQQGEDVVRQALTWQDGNFQFDPRAKLPADETIKSSIEDLIASAGVNTDALDPFQPPPAPAPVATVGESAPTAPTDTSPEIYTPPTPTYTPGEIYTPPDIYTPPSLDSGGDTEAEQNTVEEGLPSSLATDETPELATNTSTSPAPAQNQPDAPSTDQTSMEKVELYPLPSGTFIYEGLKTSFVDFPKLLSTLDADKHTGYVRITNGETSGVLLFHDGHLLEALFSNSTISHSETAFTQFRREMESGQGLIDLITLSGETVVSLAQLLTAQSLYSGLYGRFINFPALLEYLEEEAIDGSVIVKSDDETGIILLRKGTILGGYTNKAPGLAQDTSAVSAIAALKPAQIEVKSGASELKGIDVAAALQRPY